MNKKTNHKKKKKIESLKNQIKLLEEKNKKFRNQNNGFIYASNYGSIIYCWYYCLLINRLYSLYSLFFHK